MSNFEPAAALDAALLDVLLAHAPGGFAFLDTDLRFRCVNHALAEITGLSPDANVGRSVQDVLPGQSLPVVESLRRVLETGESLEGIEVSGETPGAPGVLRHWRASYYPARRRDDGSLLGLGMILSEISAQRASEAALKASRDQTRLFLRDILFSVSEGRLRLCDMLDDLPAPLTIAAAPFALSSATLRALRHETVDAAIAAGLAAGRWQDMVTAVGEASMNAVVHGGGSGEARVTHQPGRVQVSIQDRGKGIAMDRLHRATLERGYTTAGTMGHGFWMMLKTCDRVYLLTDANGTTIVLEQDRTPPEPAWLQGRI